MKKFSTFLIAGAFLVLASCGPRENRNEEQDYNDTIETMDDQNNVQTKIEAEEEQPKFEAVSTSTKVAKTDNEVTAKKREAVASKPLEKK